MDEKLIANICYEYEAAAGVIKLFLPSLFERHFDPRKTWTLEEFETINEYCDKSERFIKLNDTWDELFKHTHEE